MLYIYMQLHISDSASWRTTSCSNIHYNVYSPEGSSSSSSSSSSTVKLATELVFLYDVMNEIVLGGISGATTEQMCFNASNLSVTTICKVDYDKTGTRPSI